MDEQKLELDQIQGTVLRDRPMPYVGAYLLYEVGDPAHARRLLQRLTPHVTTAADWKRPADRAWLNVVFTHAGLRQLGVPDPILDAFPAEFRTPMRERHQLLGDIGESDPSNWDLPPEGDRFHLGLYLMAPDEHSFAAKLAIGEAAIEGLEGIRRIARQDVRTPANFREHFGFVDGISRPFIEGEGGAPLPGQDVLRAGEFVLGYVNERGHVATGPGPERFWRNGTYLSIRKLHQKVAEFRRFLIAHAPTGADQELLAAKMVGRWRSGCPLARSPERDDPSIATDPARNNDFTYHEDDPTGHKTPVGCHIRRVNPRDALTDTIVDVRFHRVLRRGAAYGPMLPDGVTDDDGIDRGVMFAFVNANPGRQFEFVQSQWVNDGDFVSAGRDKDPLVGANQGRGEYRFPALPVRRHLLALPTFVVTRGGEHVFLPGRAGLDTIAHERW